MSFETDPSIHKRLEAWIKEKGVAEIELILPDMNGIIRGKVVPAPRFLKGVSNHTLRIASSILRVTVTGEYPDLETDDEDGFSDTLDPDCVLVPDPTSICVAPGYRTPTAYVVTAPYRAEFPRGRYCAASGLAQGP